MRTALPHRRSNITRAVEWNGHSFTVTIGLDPVTWQPAEVFADTAKGGDMAAALADACILISIALQHGIGVEAMSKSLGRIPVIWGGEGSDAPASPVGAVLEALRAEVRE